MKQTNKQKFRVRIFSTCHHCNRWYLLRNRRRRRNGDFFYLFNLRRLRQKAPSKKFVVFSPPRIIFHSREEISQIASRQKWKPRRTHAALERAIYGRKFWRGKKKLEKVFRELREGAANACRLFDLINAALKVILPSKGGEVKVEKKFGKKSS